MISKNIKIDTNLLIIAFKFLFFKLRRKNIIAHPKAIIKHLNNIHTAGLLKIGVTYTGFAHDKDITFLNVNGKLNVNGSFSIGKGCRFDIGESAIVNLGNHSSINCLSKIIIMHGLDIGENSVISWDCQILDEPMHKLYYEGKKNSDNKIFIGTNVWIGSQVSVYSGSKIPNGCVIASNSVVKGIFEEENTLIAGNPAVVIKHNVTWSK